MAIWSYTVEKFTSKLISYNSEWTSHDNTVDSINESGTFLVLITNIKSDITFELNNQLGIFFVSNQL